MTQTTHLTITANQAHPVTTLAVCFIAVAGVVWVFYADRLMILWVNKFTDSLLVQARIQFTQTCVFLCYLVLFKRRYEGKCLLEQHTRKYTVQQNEVRPLISNSIIWQYYNYIDLLDYISNAFFKQVIINCIGIHF